MKIVQFCQLYSPAVYGGGEFLFFNYARELVRQGNEVSVITQRLRGSKTKETIDGVHIYRVGKSVNYKGHLSMSFIDNLSFIISSFFKGLKFCKGADIIHSNTYAPVVSGHAVSFFLRIPHVISIFDVYSQGDFWKHWSSQAGVSKSLNFFGSLFERLILKLRPAFIHTISEASRKDLINAKVRSPIKVVPCAIDLSAYKIKSLKPKNQFIYVGRHVFYKNVDVVIKAMPNVLKINPSVKFVIVGDGPKRKDWEQLSKNLGVSKNVIFTGRVNQKEKLRLINESKFLVLPSSVEGFGIVLLEAWALGKQVLVSNVPPLNELVNKSNGVIVKNDWAKIIINLLNNDKKVNFPKKYTLSVATKSLINAFERIKRN